MHALARPTSIALLTLVALGSAACVNELNPHSREVDADHTIAFVAQDDELQAQLQPDGDGFMVTPEIDREGEAFNRIGVRFDAPGTVEVEARARAAGVWGEWSPMTETYVDDSAHNVMLDVAEGSDGAQLRFKLEPGAVLSFLATETFMYEPSPADGDLDLDTEPQSEDLQGLAADGIVVTRSGWGARSRSCGPRHTPNRLTIHHTVTPNNDSMSMPARMRQIQNYHINTQGWCDIGYHFLIGQDGRVYQGRVENIVGAHAGGANTNNVGISFIGTFTSRAPSDAMLDAGARIMKAMSRTYGISLNRDKVKGHRQVGTTATSCPGQALYDRLSNLITRAQNVGSSGSGTSTSTNTCPRVQINADSLNVRRDPNTSRAAIGSLSRGEKVTRLSSTTGQSISGNTRWYRIQKGSLTGYISGAYASCVQ